MIVGCANSGPGIGLHQYAVPGRHVFTNGARGEAYPVFVRLDLFWNTDAHGMSSQNQSRDSTTAPPLLSCKLTGKELA
jgi:hypothetical protein